MEGRSFENKGLWRVVVWGVAQLNQRMLASTHSSVFCRAAVCCGVVFVLQLSGDISLFLSHDWPNQITRYGDKARLFKKKPYFQKEV